MNRCHCCQSIFWVTVSLIGGALVAGCGTSEKKLAQAEKRIAELQAKGAPDSLLSKARVFLFNARTANKMGDIPQSKKNGDSLMLMISIAEQQYQNAVNSLKPFVDSMAASLSERKKKLTGMHLRVADSMTAILDSFVKATWYPQARDKALEFDTIMIQLLKDEEKAKVTRPKVIGTWSSTEKNKWGGVENRCFKLSADGSVEITEDKRGQSDDYLKEDWKFISWGKYDLKGDTVFINITREKCERQTYWNKKKVAGKEVWEEKKAPTYDSTITNNLKDRYMTYEFMTTYLRRSK